METIRFKNRFRILYKGKILALNAITNIKGYSQFTSSFETLEDAVKTRRVYASLRGLDEQDLEIQAYSENKRHYVPGFSHQASRYFEKHKTFSGRGLRFKGLESSKDGKYNANKSYGPDVDFAKSVERFKGMSTLPKEKRKKNLGLVDTETFDKIKRYNTGTFTLGDSLVETLRKKELGRKALRKYLRSVGYSVAQAISIGEKVFLK